MKAFNTLAIGDHPVLDSLDGIPVTHNWPENLKPEVNQIVVAFQASEQNVFLVDSLCYKQLKRLLLGKKNILCQVLVHSRHSAGLYNQMEGHDIEYVPFSLDEGWAQTLFGPGGTVRIDGSGIGYADNRCLHLVLFGMTPASEAIAIQTIRIAHFPNFIRDHSLKTRITWIDPQALRLGKEFVARHSSLLDNSFYRFVNPEKEEIHTHKPESIGTQEEFVDTEWEFVQGHAWTPLIKGKLRQWSLGSHWRLVTVFAYMSDVDNLDAFRFVEPVLKGVPTLVRVEDDTLISSADTPVIPFGMPRGFHDFSLRRRDMGMAVNAVYQYTSREGTLPSSIEWEEAGKYWLELSQANRLSSMYSADSIGIKMRSIGLQEEDWDILYGMDAASIRQLSEVEHNRWTVAALLSGMRPPSADEKQQMDLDTSLRQFFKARGVHYDLRAFSELRADEKGLDVSLYDVALTRSIPLIANAIYHKKDRHA